MQNEQEHQASKEKSPLDASAARTPSSPANVLGSPVPWHASPAVFVSTPEREEAYQEKKESSFDAQRPHVGARKWTISPLNHGFSSMSLDATPRSSGNAFENSAMAFTFSSSSQSLLSSSNSTSSSSSLGYSDVSDIDMRNPTNVLETSCRSSQLSPISVGRLWEEAIASQNVQTVQQLLKCGFDASGDGAQMNVFCGLNQSTGELMAVKQLKFHNLNDDEEKAFYLTCLEREISLYKEMRHKHIVGYIDMDKDEKSGYLYIFLEYVSGGSIQSMLERFGPFSEPLVRVYTRQLLLGLEYLHKNRIVHRDIKGGNVLVDSDGVVKLADFGASKAFHEATITDACKSIRGSVFWMAPEVIKGDNYGRHADMWSVGCTVIEMLTAMHPWPGIDNTWAAIFQIAKASSGPPVPETVSNCAKDFLAKCFHLDPKMRSSASQLLEHSFVAKATEELEEGRIVENL